MTDFPELMAREREALTGDSGECPGSRNAMLDELDRVQQRVDEGQDWGNAIGSERLRLLESGRGDPGRYQLSARMYQLSRLESGMAG